MKKVLVLLFALLLTVVTITGCSQSNNTISMKSNATEDEFFLYVTDGDNKDIGELYIKKGLGEKEKVASNVLNANYEFMNNTKTVLFRDEDNNIYLKKNGSEKEKLSSDVEPYSLYISEDETAFIFKKADSDDLYVIGADKEKEKISSEASYQYAFSGDGKVAAYIDNDRKLYIKKSDSDKEKISSKVDWFWLSRDGQTIAFVRNSEDLYVRKIQDTDNKKIDSENISSVQMAYNADIITYLNDYDYDKGKGDLNFINEEGEPQKIASDITRYILSQNGSYIYFMNEDENLYLRDFNKDDKEKIASDVQSFVSSLEGNRITYLDDDSNLYLKEYNKEKEKIATDVEEWIFYNDKILYVNDDKDFYLKSIGQEKVKLTSNVVGYTIADNGNDIAYTNDNNELYYKQGNDEAQKILKDISEYSKVFFADTLLYEKKLRLDDIVGIWKNTDEDDGFFLEITDEGKAIAYFEGEEQEAASASLRDETPTTATLVMEMEENNIEVAIEVIDTEKILFDYSNLEKITSEELESLLEKQREEIALKNKVEKMEEIGYEVLYTDVMIYKEKVDVWEDHDINSTSYGYLEYGDEVYIEDTHVDETGELWLYSYVYNNNTYEYIYFWFKYSDLE